MLKRCVNVAKRGTRRAGEDNYTTSGRTKKNTTAPEMSVNTLFCNRNNAKIVKQNAYFYIFLHLFAYFY